MKKFLNPFVYYSGGKTLALGLIGMAAMVWIAGATGQTFRGLISFGIGEPPWWQLALHLTAGWALFSALLYAAARILSSSHIRLIDIAGNQALAKLPNILLLLSALLYSPQQILHDADVLEQMSVKELLTYTPPIGMLVSGIIAVAVLVWFFVWSWKGFAIAANLHDKRAVISYIGCYALTELLMAGGMLLLK